MNSRNSHVDKNDIKSYFNCLKIILQANATQNGYDLIFHEWKLSILNNLPQQSNISLDCGVFICMYARFISFNYEFNFTQNDMIRFRDMIKQEICKFEFLNIENTLIVPNHAIWT